MKKNSALTIVFGLLGVVALSLGAFFVFFNNKAKNDGTIEIKVIDLDKTILKDKNIEFVKGDTLAGLVEANFDNVKISDGMIMSIETITTPTDWSTFISIYVNEEMSAYGINEISLVDGDAISFVNTVFEYEW